MLPEPTRRGSLDKNDYPYHGSGEIKGWFSPAEGAFLEQQVWRIRGGHIVEIGSFHGLSTSYMYRACLANGNRLCSIDLGFWEEFRDNLVRWQMAGITEVLIGSSSSFVDHFADDSLDLVFIDSNHEYASVRQTIDGYWPKVRDGGVLMGHDYCPSWPGVCRAVDARFGAMPLVAHDRRSIWWVRKFRTFPHGFYKVMYDHQFTRDVRVRREDFLQCSQTAFACGCETWVWRGEQIRVRSPWAFGTLI